MKRRETSPEPLLCSECNQPVGATYFWGRHGGEWHPRCLADIERRGCAVAGAWIVDGAMTFDSPMEYITDRCGEIAGSGI